jgi:subtilisin family serine protease
VLSPSSGAPGAAFGSPGFGAAVLGAGATDSRDLYLNNDSGTYGLHLTNVIAPDGTPTKSIGSGIRIAILDTGLDFNHPDFISKGVAGFESFIGGQSAQDGFGHGTHCAGTARGPAVPSTINGFHGWRYGVAPDADLFIGKVLMNNGRGVFSAPDQNIINGIYWAVKQGCHVISMSLGEPVAIGQNFQPAYEQAASIAVQSGCLIVAAAGNDSARPGRIAPVSSPANCPSVIAVGGVDANVQMYSQSNGFIRVGNWSSGQVDVAGPAVNVFSSIPVDQSPAWPYGFKYGTSMATPHVAGILALWAGATGLKGAALWAKVQTTCVPVSWLSSADVGRGIIQAFR